MAFAHHQSLLCQRLYYDVPEPARKARVYDGRKFVKPVLRAIEQRMSKEILGSYILLTHRDM